MGCIYKIINKVNKMLYIGQTIQPDPYIRWKSHLYDAARSRGCPILGSAIRKYGANAFEFKIILLCFNEDCNELEKQYIAKLKTITPNGYNAHPGGSFKGLTHTPEVRAIIGEKSRAYHAKPGVRESNIQVRVDFYKDPANREAQSKVMKAVWENKILNGEKSNKPSDKTKEKIRESLLKYYHTNEAHGKTTEQKQKHSEAMIKAIGRPVYQYSLDDKFIAEYICIKSAADTLEIGRKAINACLSGRSKYSGGFKWYYADAEKPAT
jgi:group I intron endonuclease